LKRIDQTKKRKFRARASSVFQRRSSLMDELRPWKGGTGVRKGKTSMDDLLERNTTGDKKRRLGKMTYLWKNDLQNPTQQKRKPEAWKDISI